MIKVKQGNVVTARAEGHIDFLLHVANCQGAMNSGVAKEIRNTWPAVFIEYKRKYDLFGKLDLGTISHWGGVINLHAQEFYGYDGKRYLNYGALSGSLLNAYSLIDFGLRHVKDKKTINIGIPYLMGCDRAGGDWEIVSELVEFHLGEYNVVAYKLGERS